MDSKRAALARAGNWKELLVLLREDPGLVDAAGEASGYTSLHQAAWHGADPEVIGQLLALGPDRCLRTYKGNETALETAERRHPHRADLRYLLQPSTRSISQLIRKVVADSPGLFGPYDGNQVLCDRLVSYFAHDFPPYTGEGWEARFTAAYLAATGTALSASGSVAIVPASHFEMEARPDFWRSQFMPKLRDLAARAHRIPLEATWTTISDVFDPAPDHWGLRGDLFLWIEMRQLLCQVRIPVASGEIARAVSSAFEALTGTHLDPTRDVGVARFERGGMSGGAISGRFWMREFIPLLEQRAAWLRQSWIK